MPELPIISNHLQIKLTHSQGGSTNIVNRYNYRYGGSAPTATACYTVAQDVNAAWVSYMKPVLSNEFYLQRVDVTDLGSATGATNYYGVSQGGAATGPVLPPNDCAVIQHHIGRRFRGGHPRTYLSGLQESDVTNDGHYGPGIGGILLGAFQQFVNAIAALNVGTLGQLSAIAISYYKGFKVVTEASGRARNVPQLRVDSTGKPAPVVDPVIGYSIRPEIGGQSRRVEGTAAGALTREFLPAAGYETPGVLPTIGA
jgi:hypothetical protein